MRSLTTRLAAVAVLVAPLVGLLGSPASASGTDGSRPGGTIRVLPQADAWFLLPAVCTASPAGCLPAGPPSPYPAKTLHVGVLAGLEESRTYLSLDLLSLPSGTSMTGGSLRLPVGALTDGSRAPETAVLQACLVTGDFTDDTDGSTAAPPAVDCSKAAAPATYVAPIADEPAEFVVDLAPFAAAWSAGAAARGIALVPGPATAPTEVWHVALSAHDRPGAPVPPPTATVVYASAGADASPDPETGVEVPSARSGSGPSWLAAPAPRPQPIALGPVPAPAVLPMAVPQAAPAAPGQIQPQAYVRTAGYAYPGVFLLPLVFLAFGGWLARAMTRDLVPSPVTRTAGPPSPTR